MYSNVSRVEVSCSVLSALKVKCVLCVMSHVIDLMLVKRVQCHVS